MLIDTVGIDRVVFGTDWPFDMAIDWPVSWLLGLESLTQEEKEGDPLEKSGEAPGLIALIRRYWRRSTPRA